MSRYRHLTRNDWMGTWLRIGLFSAVILAGGILMARSHAVGFVLLTGALLVLAVFWHAANFAYHCPKCETEFEISALKDLISPHTPTAKYLRCPKCGKQGWASVLKKTANNQAG
jgi:DNA-directed RNA polymerase subunit RPC12/RpoP